MWGYSLPGYTGGTLGGNSYRNTWITCSSSFAAGIAKTCMYESGVNVGGYSDWTATTTTFKIGARTRSGSLGIGGSTEDTWTIDHRKELVNFVNGAL